MFTDNFSLRTFLIVGVAIVLLGDGLVLATYRDSTAASPSTQGAVGPPASLAPILPGLESFVEEARGLKFKTPVPVELLSHDAFTAKLREGDGAGKERDRDQAVFAGFLRALGLVHGDIDLDAAATAVEEDGIVGFYDPKEKRLFVRGVEPTPFVRQVLVHELTHALDDQHFGLDRPALDDRDDESSDSFRALVEGNAVTVERKYVASLSEDEQQQATDEEDSASSASNDIPDVVAKLLSYPYAVGPGLIDALTQDGGRPRVDRAIIDPPVTSEQTLHPEKFLAGEGAVPVTKPEPDGKVVDRGVLGEVTLLLMFEEVLPAAAAHEAAAGWGGDQYVAWRSGGKTCVRWAVVMDTPADTAEVVSALRTWQDRNPGASVEAGATVTVKNCG